MESAIITRICIAMMLINIFHQVYHIIKSALNFNKSVVKAP